MENQGFNRPKTKICITEGKIKGENLISEGHTIPEARVRKYFALRLSTVTLSIDKSNEDSDFSEITIDYNTLLLPLTIENLSKFQGGLNQVAY